MSGLLILPLILLLTAMVNPVHLLPIIIILKWLDCRLITVVQNQCYWKGLRWLSGIMKIFLRIAVILSVLTVSSCGIIKFFSANFLSIPARVSIQKTYR